jgi:hypothetical protein
MNNDLLLSKKIRSSLIIIGYYNPNRFMPSRVHPVASDGELFYAFYPDGRYTLMKTFDETDLPAARFIPERGYRVFYSESVIYMSWESGKVIAENLDDTILSCKKFIRLSANKAELEIAGLYLQQFLQEQSPKKKRLSKSVPYNAFGHFSSQVNANMVKENEVTYGSVERSYSIGKPNKQSKGKKGVAKKNIKKKIVKKSSTLKAASPKRKR